MSAELAQAIAATAGKLGVDPIDLATAISYETAGTFDPWKAGPTTKWGQHRGLIQWGEPQRQKYGVTQDMPVPAQVEAAGQYLIDAGVKPGMGLLDIYSAINAGGVGRYNRSDAHAGGAPGPVADKVNNQMGGHRVKAEALLAGLQPAPMAQQPAPQPPMSATAPMAQPQMPAPMSQVAAPQGGLLAGQEQQGNGALDQIMQERADQEMAGLLAPPKPIQHLNVQMAPAYRPKIALKGYR